MHKTKKQLSLPTLDMVPAKVDVTVLIASYNGEETIAQAIRSIYAGNSDLNIQIIVGDDASEDDTSGAAYAAGAETYRNEENMEKSRTLNYIWQYAKGDYVLVMDDDDTLEPGALTKMVHAFNVLIHQTDDTKWFLYGQTQYHGDRVTLHYPPPVFNPNVFFRHNPVCSVVMVHRKTINDHQIRYIEDSRHHSEDWAYMLNMIVKGFKGYALPDTLVLHYNYHPHERQTRQADNDYAVMREHFGKRFDPMGAK